MLVLEAAEAEQKDLAHTNMLEKPDTLTDVAYMSEKTYAAYRDFLKKDVNTYDNLPIVINNLIPYGAVLKWDERCDKNVGSRGERKPPASAVERFNCCH